MPWQTLNTLVEVKFFFLCFATGTYSDISLWFFIHYQKSVTSNTCVHSNFGMTTNQNLRSTKRFAVIGYTGSKRSRTICCFLTWNEIITENEKKVNILITFQFYQLLFLFLTNL